MSRVWTAALVVIGDEILSGRTQDRNIAQLASWLNVQGIRLAEARVVPDVEVPGDHLAGDGFDDHLLELVAHSFPGTANVDPTTRKEREDDRLIAARSR